MEANKNFAKWLSCGIQISGTFGLHHVYTQKVNETIMSLFTLRDMTILDQFQGEHLYILENSEDCKCSP
jgi:hypothetical protein